MLKHLGEIFIGIGTAIVSIFFPVTSEKFLPADIKPETVEYRVPTPTAISADDGSSTKPTSFVDLEKLSTTKVVVMATTTSRSRTETSKIASSTVKVIKVAKLGLPQESGTSTSVSTPVTYVPNGKFPLDPEWKDAIVNVFCADRNGEIDSVSSGSGVFIDKRGVILTNAHVAQNFIFSDWPNPSLLNCSIRVGSPAYPLYRATLLYLPEAWMKDYFDQLYAVDDTNYVYGLKDYGLLLVTSRTDPTKDLPKEFPYIPVSIDSVPAKGSFNYMLGYAASFLGGVTILQGLSLVSSPVIVHHVNSLENSGDSDTIAFAGSVAGQHGSSGGAVIDKDGKVTGMPTFFDDGQGETTDDNILNAITLSYVSRDLKKDTGFSLEEFLVRDDLASISRNFVEVKVASYQRTYADLVKKKQGIRIPGVVYP